MSDWISINELLPVESEWDDIIVCAIHKGKKYTLADVYFVEGKFKTKDHHYGCFDDIDDVTHWMPLPEPPK